MVGSLYLKETEIVHRFKEANEDERRAVRGRGEEGVYGREKNQSSALKALRNNENFSEWLSGIRRRRQHYHISHQNFWKTCLKHNLLVYRLHSLKQRTPFLFSLSPSAQTSFFTGPSYQMFLCFLPQTLLYSLCRYYYQAESGSAVSTV